MKKYLYAMGALLLGLAIIEGLSIVATRNIENGVIDKGYSAFCYADPCFNQSQCEAGFYCIKAGNDREGTCTRIECLDDDYDVITLK